MSEPTVGWMRHRPDAEQTRAAAGKALAAGVAVGLVVGGAVFYLARLFASREALTPAPRPGQRVGEGSER